MKKIPSRKPTPRTNRWISPSRENRSGTQSTASHPVLALQKLAGNHIVRNMFNRHGVLQGVFTFNYGERSAVDDAAPTKKYRILGSITYNGGANTAYWLENTADPDEQVYADKDSGAVVDISAIKKSTKRIRPEGEDDLSDFSESDDDTRTTLTPYGKQRILIKKGKHKKARLATSKIEKEKSSGRFRVDTGRRRKSLAVHRLKKTTGVSDVDAEEYVDVGKQTLHIGKGTGFFIMPGGNVDTRPKTVKEPPADYNGLFTQMQGLGKDPAASLLYKKATKTDLPSGTDTLTDPQIASMSLFYMNSDAGQLETELGQRTQLTEDLSKLTTITGFSEFSRSMIAEEEGTATSKEAPYDASLFVKQGLMKVSKGESTLQNMFFQGTGGETSVFMGAPSKEHSPSKTGGSEVLQNPFGFPSRLERQMGIFPDLKSDFKTSLNALKSTTSPGDLLTLTASDITALETKAKQQQKEDAEKMLEMVKKQPIPTASTDRFSFWAEDYGFIKKQRKILGTMIRKAKGNAEALAVMEEIKKAINAKEKEAMK